MSDFETQLKDRMAASAARVQADDALYDRAEARHRVHTRHRAITGGIGALAVAAVATVGALWATGTLIDRPQPPIVQQPDRPDGASSVPPVLVAGWPLLDEAGLPDDHPARVWDEVVRAYPIDRQAGGDLDYRDLVVELRSDRGSLVARLDEHELILLEGWEGTTPGVELHGVTEVRGVPHALVARPTDDGGTSVRLHRLEGAGEAGDVVATYGRNRPVQRVSALGDEDVAEPYIVVVTRSDGADRVELFTIRGAVTVSDRSFPSAVCADCSYTSLVASVGGVAYLEQDPTGAWRLKVEHPRSGGLIAERRVDDLGDLKGARLEVSERGVLVDDGSGSRWYADTATGDVTLLDHLPAGYVTFAPTDPTQPSPAPDDPFVLPAEVDGWSPLPPLPTEPGTEPRVHLAVWAGDRLLVATSAGPADDRTRQLYAYDPEGDAWTTLAEPPAVAQWHEGAVWTGDEIVLLGGAGGDPSEGVSGLLGAWAYAPNQDTWRPLRDAPIADRWGFSATWTGDEIVVWGGASWADEGTGEVTPYADGAAWDPATDTWRELAAGPLSPRIEHGAVWNGRRLIVFGGGYVDRIEGEFGWDVDQHRHDAAVYDPVADSWSSIASPPEIGPLVAAAYTDTEIVYWSGYVGADVGGTEPGPGAVWDPATGTHEPLPPLPMRDIYRRDDTHSMWAAEIGRWIVFSGGCGEGCNHRFGEGAAFDPATRTWTHIQAPSYVGFGSHPVWSGSRMYAVGGWPDFVGADLGPVRGGVWTPPS